jgi:hypothetical protein
MLTNKDFYGTKIRNEDDPLVQQLKDLAVYQVKSLEPLSSRNLRQGLREGQSPASASKSFLGLTPAPASVNKTPFERALGVLSAEQQPIGGRTKEAAEKLDRKRAITRGVAKGDMEPLRAAIRSGQLTPDDARQILKDSAVPPLEQALSRVELKAVVERLHLATDEEKAKAKPILLKRLRAYAESHTPTETQDIVARFRKNGLLP